MASAALVIYLWKSVVINYGRQSPYDLKCVCSTLNPYNYINNIYVRSQYIIVQTTKKGIHFISRIGQLKLITKVLIIIIIIIILIPLSHFTMITTF